MEKNTILLLGAMSIADPIPEIAEELRVIKRTISKLPNLKVEYDSSLTQQELGDVLRDHTDQVLILHFAGHSGSESLQTDDSVIYVSHIADILKTWKHKPDLFFLNGCNSAGQAQCLLDVGVECVIATRNFVDDFQAKEFAAHFYQDLCSNDGVVSLNNAFKRAASTVNLPYKQKARSLDISDLELWPSEWDWGIFCPDNDLAEFWNLKNPFRLVKTKHWLKDNAAFGTDKYGHFADIQIADVWQRFRWVAATDDLVDFWIADTECTQALWQAVMGQNNNPAEFQISSLHPVESVSWPTVQEFLEQFSMIIPDLSARLPTELEWERACKADTNTVYSFGDEVTSEQVNFASKSTIPVKSQSPNAWGLYQMHGNLWEWCEDDFDDWSDLKVLRGGSWANDAQSVSSTVRGKSITSNRDYTIGFRFIIEKKQC